jgi:circadian clock protein KaiB
MTKKSPPKSSETFEEILQGKNPVNYVLRLFIVGNSSKSVNAILNIRKLCEQELQGRCQLEVIDIRQQPGKARSEQIVATPTLIKTAPLPIRRIIGDLSQREKVLNGLGLS